MKLPETSAIMEMSWVDYCDALSNEYFVRYAQREVPVRPADCMSDLGSPEIVPPALVALTQSRVEKVRQSA